MGARAHGAPGQPGIATEPNLVNVRVLSVVGSLMQQGWAMKAERAGRGAASPGLLGEGGLTPPRDSVGNVPGRWPCARLNGRERNCDRRAMAQAASMPKRSWWIDKRHVLHCYASSRADCRVTSLVDLPGLGLLQPRARGGLQSRSTASPTRFPRETAGHRAVGDRR